MSFEDAASRIAARVRAVGRGFLTMRREELRDLFDIGKFTEAQAERAVEALHDVGIHVFPHPFDSYTTLRLYDHRHPLGEIAHAVIDPNSSTDAPLRRAADTFARERAGKEIRSDDVPWLEAFQLYLLLVLGREPEGWEDLKDDRPSSLLARELAVALGFPEELSDGPSIVGIASAGVAIRPRTRRWRPEDFATSANGASNVGDFVGTLETRDRRVKEDYERVLHTAARLLLDGREVPTTQVELGLLGMRRRRQAEV
jgi:hypothetical protein